MVVGQARGLRRPLRPPAASASFFHAQLWPQEMVVSFRPGWWGAGPGAWGGLSAPQPLARRFFMPSCGRRPWHVHANMAERPALTPVLLPERRMRIAREYLGSTRVKSVERRAKRCIIRPADGRAESCLTLLETQLPRKNEVFVPVEH